MLADGTSWPDSYPRHRRSQAPRSALAQCRYPNLHLNCPARVGNTCITSCWLPVREGNAIQMCRTQAYAHSEHFAYE
jgi:hypothetical protein